MITVFWGYTKTGKQIRADLDTETGTLYIVYVASGRRVRFNEEQYTKESDFTFLIREFRGTLLHTM